MVIIKLELELS